MSRETLPNTVDLPDVEAIAIHVSGLHRNMRLLYDEKTGLIIGVAGPIGRRNWWPKKPRAHKPKQSYDGRMRTIAGLEARRRYRRLGKTLPVFAVGGNNYPGLAPSQGYVLGEDLNTKGIPKNLLTIIDRGGNTISDLWAISKAMKKMGINSVLHISSEFHEVVSNRASKRTGEYFMSAEQLLWVREDPYGRFLHRPLVEAIRQSPVTEQRLISQQARVHKLEQHSILGERVYDLTGSRLRFFPHIFRGAPVTTFDPYTFLKMTGRPVEEITAEITRRHLAIKEAKRDLIIRHPEWRGL